SPWRTVATTGERGLISCRRLRDAGPAYAVPRAGVRSGEMRQLASRLKRRRSRGNLESMWAGTAAGASPYSSLRCGDAPAEGFANLLLELFHRERLRQQGISAFDNVFLHHLCFVIARHKQHAQAWLYLY